MDPKYKIKASIAHDDKTFTDMEFNYTNDDDLCFWMKHITIMFYSDYSAKRLNGIKEFDPNDESDGGDVETMCLHDDKFTDFWLIMETVRCEYPKETYYKIIDYFGHMSDYSLYIEQSEYFY
jgi:hypothetical protein